ncbi:MAG: hypothetical protein FDZ69_14035, partial [Deltaproteobacteria bacterium]
KGGAALAIGPAGVPSRIAGSDVGAGLPEAGDKDGKRHRARSFLRENRELLRITDPDAELPLRREEHDSLGKSHYRFQQSYRGVPVYGRESLVHLDADGNIYLFQGHHLPTPDLVDVTPAVTGDRAEAICAADIGRAVTAATVELVIYYHEPAAAFHLAWHIDAVADDGNSWRCFVDAGSGAVIARYSTVMDGIAPVSGLDLDGVRRSFTAWYDGSYYYCYDVTRPVDDSAAWTGTSTARGDIQIYDGANGAAVPKSPVPTSGWDPAAVSVISNLYTTLDYYQQTHQRSGIDGYGGHVTAFIHQPGAAGNAYWNGSYLAFGNDQSPLVKLPGALDIVAHEVAHGVTQYSADLEYQNQSGALNESMSDVFAAMVDRDDWLIGEDAYTGPAGHLRDLRDPHNADAPQPATMAEYVYLPISQDHGGVHINSGIPNRAAYLVADGLGVEGLGTSIGRVKTERIWYRALTQYLSKYSDFLHARWATEQAASDLYGPASPERTAVQAAWSAVGVNDVSSTTVAPTSADPVVGEDRLVYVWNGGIFEQNALGTVSGPYNYYPATNARPAVYYGTQGLLILYVTEGTYDLRAIRTGTWEDVLIDNTEYWWSLAVSQDGEFLAYTRLTEEPYIHIDDGQRVYTYTLYNPTTSSGGTDTSYIAFADVLSFDYRGRHLIYDYLIRIPTSLGIQEIWRIGILDRRDGSIVVPFTGTDPVQQIGNPSFAANNDYVFAFDYWDTATQQSAVFAHNMRNGRIGLVFNPDLDGLNRMEWGRPSFRGDDGALAVQTAATVCQGSCTVQRRIVSVPLVVTGDDTWQGDPGAATYLSTFQGQYPVACRAGMRTITASLAPSPATVSFGNVAADRVSKTVALVNTGNVDLFVSHATVTGPGLSLSASLGLLPRNATMPVTVHLDTTGLTGAKTGTLTITSDAGTPTLTIPVSANILPHYRLTVSKSGTGSGTVTSSPGTLTWSDTTGTGDFFSSTTVRLTAVADAGSAFDGWSGACTGLGTCQVYMTAAKQVTATFIPPGQVVTPGSLTVPAADSDGSYLVSWGASGTGYVTYVLEQATSADFSDAVPVYTGMALSASLSGRSLGAVYYYRVKATKGGFVDSSWRTGAAGCAVPGTALATP